jgi:hypothetical protein
MPGLTLPITLNGREFWVYPIEQDGGLRLRFSTDEWEQISLAQGQRVNVRVPGQKAEWLFLSQVIEMPPVVWLVLVRRLRATG